MKKRYKIFKIVTLILFFLLNSSKVFANNEKEACQAYYDAVRNSEDVRATSSWGIWGYDDFGFMLKQKSAHGDEWTYEKNEDGFYKVGHIYSKEAALKINSQDLIIRVNGEELKDADRLYEIEREEEEITLELLDQNNELYKVTLKKDFNSYSYLKHLINDVYITDINIKKGTFEISLNESFQFFYTKEDNESDVNHILHRLAQGNIIYKVEGTDNQYMYHICSPTKEEFSYSYLLDPSEIRVLNLLKSDQDLEKTKYKITPYDKKVGNKSDALRVEVNKISTITLKNYYNLRSFPFDKQKLIYKISDDSFLLDSRVLMPREQTFKTLKKFINTDDIPGWNKIDYEINLIKTQKVAAMEGDYNSGIEIVVFLERKSGYYIFKVIFPIMLILMVCWSVVWIHPRELESRLTITIVCLLSLIAYNFVIDAELPKLEYLTVLDWIILLSYVYAAIPNFVTIASFKFHKSNEAMSNKIENFGKKLGPTSYLFFVLTMILSNGIKNPENTGGILRMILGQ